jgi:hypothetical protein
VIQDLKDVDVELIGSPMDDSGFVSVQLVCCHFLLKEHVDGWEEMRGADCEDKRSHLKLVLLLQLLLSRIAADVTQHLNLS